MRLHGTGTEGAYGLAGFGSITAEPEASSHFVDLQTWRVGGTKISAQINDPQKSWQQPAAIVGWSTGSAPPNIRCKSCGDEAITLDMSQEPKPSGDAFLSHSSLVARDSQISFGKAIRA
ncbi:hypothetical protein SCUP234_08577 [Seiridium cupressi]